MCSNFIGGIAAMQSSSISVVHAVIIMLNNLPDTGAMAVVIGLWQRKAEAHSQMPLFVENV